LQSLVEQWRKEWIEEDKNNLRLRSWVKEENTNYNNK
jgi:hypothetical protein